MTAFLTLVVSGAVTGAIYSLVASGLTLTYTATGIFNFAYGGVAFSSAYLFYLLHLGCGWPIWLTAILVIAVFAPLLGVVLDLAVFRRLARAPESAKIVATVGLLLAIPALTEWICDGVIDLFNVSLPRSTTVLQAGFPPGLGPVPEKTWHIGTIPINSNELVVFISAIVCALALWFLMRSTPLGLRMRALVDRPALAQMRGVNDIRTSRYAWIIGTILAALAGVVAAPILGSISTTNYITMMFAACAAVVVGGMRSIPYVFVAGLCLGIIQDLVTGYANFASSITGFNQSMPTVILLIALLLLARDRSRRGGTTADETPPPDYLSDLPAWRRAAPWVVAVAFLIIYVLLLANSFWTGIMVQGLALSIVFLSFVVVTGMGGMVSLAQATFVTTASLTAGLLYQNYHLPFLGAAAIAVLVTIVVGLIVAIPALRLGGLSLALATLALAILGDNVLFQWSWLTNSNTGWTIPRPKIGPFDFTSNRTMAIGLLIIVGIVMLLIHNLKKSPWGRSIAAVRSSDIGASTSGVSPFRVKLALFALSAAIAAVGGIMYASYQTSATNSTTPFTDGLLWLATVVLFGIRRPAAAALAGVVSAASTVIISSGFHFWSWVPSWLSWNGTQSSEIPLILFGLGAVSLARDPDGFLAHTAEQNHRRRANRLARRKAADVAASERAATSALAERHRTELISEGVVTTPSAGSAPTGNAILQVSGLRAGYGDVEVLHHIDLNVHSSSVVGLLGANGSGKSTFCSTLAGLLQATSGTVLLDGVDLRPVPAFERVQRGLLVVPESRGVFPGLTVEENLQLRLTADERDEVYSRFTHLRDRRRLPAGHLSGGEQQILALAPVLTRPPRLIIADEPTLGLAPKVIDQMLGLFDELKRHGTGILLVEEKARHILTVSDYVAFLELGQIIWSGPREDLDDQQLAGSYLGLKV
jgi:ABC-type branched-subunit amino acid transport system ATPase component/branched-subunit amino acid ABC-type transport system permease component